jgi:hypothetical protein
LSINVHSFSLIVELGTLVKHADQILALLDPLLKVDLLSQTVNVLRIVNLSIFKVLWWRLDLLGF